MHSRAARQFRYLRLGVIVSLAGFILFYGSSWIQLFKKWNWLCVQDVRIDIQGALSEHRIRDSLPDLKGHSLIFLNPTSVLETIRKNPWVMQATVKKEFPDKVYILITSKKPAAILQKDDRGIFIDEKGIKIEDFNTSSLVHVDYPVITLKEKIPRWQLSQGIEILNRIESKLPTFFKVSQIVLETYPQYKVYFSHSKVEWLMSAENDVSQLDILYSFLKKNLNNIYQINLTLPKKAVVSSSLSH